MTEAKTVAGTRPVTVTLVDDYDVVLMRVANFLDGYRDRVVVAEIDTNKPVEDVVDIVLYDCFAQPESATTTSRFRLPLTVQSDLAGEWLVDNLAAQVRDVQGSLGPP